MKVHHHHTIIAVIVGIGLGLALLSYRPLTPIVQAPTVTPEITTATTCPDLHTHSNLILVDEPPCGVTISNPLMISGKARGVWYFEATFPVRLLDGNGAEIASGPATAKGEWTTEDFVPFTASLAFTKPTTPTGMLVFAKDNPSGLPELNDSVSIPVKF